MTAGRMRHPEWVNMDGKSAAQSDLHRANRIWIFVEFRMIIVKVRNETHK